MLLIDEIPDFFFRNHVLSLPLVKLFIGEVSGVSIASLLTPKSRNKTK